MQIDVHLDVVLDRVVAVIGDAYFLAVTAIFALVTVRFLVPVSDVMRVIVTVVRAPGVLAGIMSVRVRVLMVMLVLVNHVRVVVNGIVFVVV